MTVAYLLQYNTMQAQLQFEWEVATFLKSSLVGNTSLKISNREQRSIAITRRNCDNRKMFWFRDIAEGQYFTLAMGSYTIVLYSVCEPSVWYVVVCVKLCAVASKRGGKFIISLSPKWLSVVSWSSVGAKILPIGSETWCMYGMTTVVYSGSL